MGETRDLYDKIDLGIKVAIPLAVLGATLLYNCSSERIRAAQTRAADDRQLRQQCLENQFRLIELVCPSSECPSPSEKRAAVISHVSELTGPSCQEAGMPVSEQLKSQVVTSVATTGNITRTAETARALQQSAPPAVEAQQPVPVKARSTPTATASTGAYRLFIQYPQSEQAGAVNTLRAALEKSRLAGRRMVVPPAEEVAAAVSQTQVRCFKPADCQHVEELARFLSLVIGTTVATRDLTRHESAARARNGDFELWFSRQPIPMATPAS